MTSVISSMLLIELTYNAFRLASVIGFIDRIWYIKTILLVHLAIISGRWNLRPDMEEWFDK